jgi:Cu+-exporting ATPase
VLWGEGSFDESSLTGEAQPVYKKQGDKIISGSVCIDSLIHYQATHDASHSMLSSIVNLLESALSKKPRIEQLANQISGYFSTSILLLALATFGFWYLFEASFEMALIVGISVIVIACPCALGLATPMATLVGVSISAKRGILFKEASFLETMAKSTVLALDKTGTITQGKPSVVHADIKKDFDPEILYALVLASNHPISKGIQSYLENHYTLQKNIVLQAHKNIQAKGIQALYKGKKLLGGNGDLLSSFELKTHSNNALFFFAIDDTLMAKFELQDSIREGAKESIQKIQKMGIEVIMLTGDHAQSAKNIAQKVGIHTLYAKLLPQDKAQHIQKLQNQGKAVVMVGDGINDAIALASADIGISMGKGADVAISVSDIVLLDEEFKSIEEAFRLSKRTYRAIKENLAFSLLYNLIAVPLAMLGFITPLIAALSMSLSSLVVIANSLRIKKIKL